eukprot:TRINITY_DN4142_c0_g1_i1.p1 TRINITY_DN4142_c0_g1~~TRINITY_DN4142_c0_g1_i1.p1  ORF type:complete len:224 (+),score=35.82 TRINITY_DN4142_c0_g1_i1:84-755(+)
MKRAVCSTAGGHGGVVQQKRHYWFDRFVRNPTSGGAQSYETLSRRNLTRRPGIGPRHALRQDLFFGYIPNVYGMEDRAMFDRRTLEPDRIRPPCGEIPDINTFLARADTKREDLTEYEDQFEDWDDLMSSSYMELVYKKGIPAKAARSIFAARELYNNGLIFHKRPQHDWAAWAKKRGSNPPFPENYYPHMRIAKYREVLQESQTTGATLASWERMRMAAMRQ